MAVATRKPRPRAQSSRSRSRKVSPRKRAANRANATKSTGPRTPEGKATSSRNRIVHGIFCPQVVLEGENHDAYDEIHEGLMQSLMPTDVMQTMLAERIAASSWRLRRVHEAEEALYFGKSERLVQELRQAHEDDPSRTERFGPAPKKIPPPGAMVALFADAPAGATGECALMRYQTYEMRLERSITRCLRELRQLQKRTDKETTAAHDAYILAMARGDVPAEPVENTEEQDAAIPSPSGTGVSPVQSAEKACGKSESPDASDRAHGRDAHATGEAQSRATGELQSHDTTEVLSVTQNVRNEPTDATSTPVEADLPESSPERTERPETSSCCGTTNVDKP